jgi:hypothetical protein
MQRLAGPTEHFLKRVESIEALTMAGLVVTVATILLAKARLLLLQCAEKLRQSRINF